MSSTPTSTCHIRINPTTPKWRYTWEAQSHSSTLRLFLFHTKTSIHCTNLNTHLAFEHSLIIVTFLEDQVDTSLRVPLPKVLVDVETPVQVRALDDHIEVKLVLLLPVDHPMGFNFHSVLGLAEYDGPTNVGPRDFGPLCMDSDVKNLSSMEEVYFYCRSCSTKLTRPLRFFKEMPSVNWREVADNWFGACCCSFGGISEKLVSSYAKSYTCATGLCLLSTTSVILCKDDLLGCEFSDSHGSQNYESELNYIGDNCLSKITLDSRSENGTILSCENQSKKMENFDGKLSCPCHREDNLASRLECGVIEKVSNRDSFSASLPGCCADTKYDIENHESKCCSLDAYETSPKEQKLEANNELLVNQKIFLNGFLGNGFMARSSNLSKDVQWIEFSCPHCECLIGAYPSINGHAPLDGGVRLFKCYISTCLPVGGSSDLFRNYTLEKMFTNQLMESANDELSFRTVVRDLKTKSPMLQIVLLNPNSWCCTGYCLCTVEPAAKIDMYPTIKVLFSDSNKSTEFQISMVEEWVTKNQADEVFMLASQIKELRESLESANNLCPPSHTLLQGLFLSTIKR